MRRTPLVVGTVGLLLITVAGALAEARLNFWHNLFSHGIVPGSKLNLPDRNSYNHALEEWHVHEDTLPDIDEDGSYSIKGATDLYYSDSRFRLDALLSYLAALSEYRFLVSSFSEAQKVKMDDAERAQWDRHILEARVLAQASYDRLSAELALIKGTGLEGDKLTKIISRIPRVKDGKR